MKGYIYLIENKINEKKYIGKTYLNIEKRWKQHCNDSRRFNRPLYQAMEKYGIENFSIKEIEYCDNLEEREKYWISFYDSYHNGYNATLGGDGKTYFEYSDEEVISKYKELGSVKDVASYFNCDPETIRIRLKNNGINTSLIPKMYKKVYQYDLNNNYIQSFESISAAASWLIENNFSKGQIKHIVSNISKNIRNIENRKQAYGFIWKSHGE